MDYGIVSAVYTPAQRVVTTVPPAVEPVTVAEAKAWLKVETADDDSLIADLIVAVREAFEAECRVSLITQTRTLFLSGFPSAWGEVRLPYPPLRSIVSAQYLDTTGTLLAIAPSSYGSSAGSIPGKLWLPYGSAWPVTGPYPDAVQVAYTCGYGDTASALPMAARLAIRSLVAANYNNREGVQFLQGGQMVETPLYKSFMNTLNYGFYG